MVDDEQQSDAQRDAAEVVAEHDELAGRLDEVAYPADILMALEPFLDDILIEFLEVQMDLVPVEVHSLGVVLVDNLVEEHSLVVVGNQVVVVHNLAMEHTEVAPTEDSLKDIARVGIGQVAVANTLPSVVAELGMAVLEEAGHLEDNLEVVGHLVVEDNLKVADIHHTAINLDWVTFLLL